jgi:hypothetical protein
VTAPTPSLAEQLAAHLRVHRDDELDVPDIAIKWRVPAHTVDALLADGVAAGLFNRIARKYKEPVYVAGPRLHLTPAPAPAPAAAPGKRGPNKATKPDPRAVQVFRAAPIPKQSMRRRGSNGPYAEILARMQPGDMVKLTHNQARSMYQHARKTAGVQLVLRKLDDQLTGVWRQ